ncbi:dienelactone hydrolase-like protein [Paraglaciecola sp. T6c]|uniref:alpha/beta hydrolase family protein n=1 Tax=Pseudoalteromonas atlantica (strain T6c / ATCC BAA-1087) TaxID=3042615 RepID=UPI00005C5DA0|nr:dienelactone hydrolase [Paraglaciecola sp. T6c]ABG41813.1 dienelactone hydrolase-like protein [Paraglaciecola sp. T6c]
MGFKGVTSHLAKNIWLKGAVVVLALGVNVTAFAENRIDTQRPDAPELAAYGEHSIGVRQLEVANPNQIEMLKLDPTKPEPATLPRYDRPLTLEVWYPAQKGSTGNTTLKAYIRDGKTEVDLQGKAVRDAKPEMTDSAFPLVLISHGYPGNRFLLAHLAENIASKGYVVVSIDHTDSTYRTKAAFSSTLVNRPVDQLFVLSQIEGMAKDKDSFLYGLVDTSDTGLIGYSMGGYGAVINAGAGVTEQVVASKQSPPFGTLKRHQSGIKSGADKRLKTVIAFAPWGMNYHMFSNDTLKEISVPMLLIAGSQDDVSGYENGVRAIWQGASNVNRSLLTYDNANHNAGAVMPAPEESYMFDKELGFNISEHYIDAVWDNARMNNIAQHFVTAWLDKYLKNDTSKEAYLDIVPDSNGGVYALDEEGEPKPEHTYWKGFGNRTAKGLHFETLAPKK